MNADSTELKLVDMLSTVPNKDELCESDRVLLFTQCWGELLPYSANISGRLYNLLYTAEQCI